MAAPSGQEARRDTIVVHETGGEKYFEAVRRLHTSGDLSSLEFVEASVLRKFLWDLIRKKRSVREAAARAVRNARFRGAALTLRNKQVILALAPWDIRLPPYAQLRRRNRLIYHTSWPYWDGRFVPRRYGVATGALKRMWLSALSDPAVHIVAVTAAAARGVQSVLGGRECTVIPHAVSDEFYRERARWSGGELRVIFIGDLVRAKGVYRLPEIDRALSTLPVRFDVVGEGPARASLEAEGSGRIRLHGAIEDRSKLAAMLGDSHLLLLPSEYELFGMVIAEAMSAGVPAIASDLIGPRQLIASGADGVLVPGGDPRQFAAAIAGFFEDPKRWRAMSDACRARGKDFSLDRIMSQWRKVLC